MKKDKDNDGLVIALDLGTTNIKGAVFDFYGREIAYESVEYNLYTPSNSIVENNVELYWRSIQDILVGLSRKLGEKSKNVLAIGTSSQGETIVPVDKNGAPLRNAIVWIDTRTIEEVKEISEAFDQFEMFKKTGLPEVSTSWPATRISWIKKNEPDIFSKTYKFLLLEDYIIYRLTGEFYGEHTVYSSSYYYDIIEFKYIDSVLEYLEIGKSKLPEILKPGSIVGTLIPEIAELTKFPKDTKIVIGAMDQICGAVGAGNINKEYATETTGSAFAMVVTIDKPIFDFEKKLPCLPHAIEGLYALVPYSSNGGVVYRWFKDNFCSEEKKHARERQKNVFNIMNNLAKDIPPGSEGLIMLPFINGALFPEFNPLARGVYFNFGINHKKAHFIRATLESISYMMRTYIETLREMGIELTKVISIGGGANSKLWSQIKADVCSINLQTPTYTEMALLGSAVITSKAIGIFKKEEEASKRFVEIKNDFKPDKRNKKIYDDAFKRYKELYDNLKTMFG